MKKSVLIWLLFSTTLLAPLRGKAQEPPPEVIAAGELQWQVDGSGGGRVVGESNASQFPPEEQQCLLELAPGALDMLRASPRGAFCNTFHAQAAPPSSAVEPLATYQTTLTFTVSWSGESATSEVITYNLQVQDGIPSTWSDWLTETTALSATFAGQDGHTYYFRSQATDADGLIEDWPPDPDTLTTVDITPPSSAVDPLDDRQTTLFFTVTWRGTDAASGVASYDLQARDGVTGTWSDWLTQTTALSATFAGQNSHTYYFHSRARDHAGNEEPWPSLHDTSTTVDSLAVFLPLILNSYSTEPRYPNDPYYSSQWALEKIGAPVAWGYTTGQSTIVAVLDTGTDLDHPDLAGKVRTDVDWDYVNDDDVADDDHGHGTHVSGIAGAETDNGAGVAAVGWETQLLPLKVLRSDGVGYEDDLAEAIRYAADNEADVINMSLGGPGPCPQILQDAADYAYARGVVLVAAAGNHDCEQGCTKPNTEMFPANCEHVLGVAATEPSDAVSGYSNHGSHVSVAAPGSEIYGTLMGGWYGNKLGTSMATPHVAGVAALLRAHYPTYTPDQVASAILDNTNDLGAAGWDEYYGCGRINASRALSTGARGASPICQSTQPWAAAQTGIATDTPFAPGEVLIAFRPGVQAAQAALRHSASAELLPTLGVWRLHVRPGQEQAIRAQWQADPNVAYAELNYLVFAQ
jgi:subtilisin family serine protease